MDAKQIFENGSVLIRDYKGHEQMLMNEGTFIGIMDELIETNKNNVQKINELQSKMDVIVEKLNSWHDSKKGF